jgi:hypothetical protein
MMLDFPELFAPAKIVRGRISIEHSFTSDLNPLTEIFVMPFLDSDSFIAFSIIKPSS